MKHLRLLLLVPMLLLLVLARGCSLQGEAPMSDVTGQDKAVPSETRAHSPMLMEEKAKESAPPGRKGSGARPRMSRAKHETDSLLSSVEGGRAKESREEAPPEKAEEAEEAGALRSWFPETFLFEPLVVTDAQGLATVSVKVPDRLTTWRILGLAHARNGTQAGAEASFLGTLPAYVDPVLPPFLRVGDRLDLPILLVNTTQEELRAPLVVEMRGGAEGRIELSTVIPASGSRVVKLPLTARRPVRAELLATLGHTDAQVRFLPVHPRGRPVEQQVSGTLAARRSFALVGPEELDPGSSRIRLLVFPGALALLRSELAAAPDRSGLAHDAYGLLLAGQGPELLRALGEEPGLDAMRQQAILGAQRVIRHARAPDLASAVLLAQAALAHPGSPVLSRLAERLVAQMASSQRPDGSFGGGQGWTLQRLLVTSAQAVRVVALAGSTSERADRRARGVQLRSSGLFERNLRMVKDPYTAAAILSTRAVAGSLAETLRERLRAAIKQRKDGARFLPIMDGVVRSDGLRPSQSEATALAVLALERDPKAPWLADLGASLLAGYEPGLGWGDGRSNLAALRAVLRLFKDPLPDRIGIVLKKDGETVTEGSLSAARMRDLLAIEAPVSDVTGTHTWSVQADPPVAGLGFSLSLRCWVPWELAPSAQGLELSIERPEQMAVSRAAEIRLLAVAPAQQELRLRHALPAGVHAEPASLEALVQAGTIRSFETDDSGVTMLVPARDPGQTFRAAYRVVPTLAGTLHSAASSLALDARPEQPFYLPPRPWKVR